MKEPNLCYNAAHSCSACCGLHNLRLTLPQKEEWLRENTAAIKQMKAPGRSELLDFRYKREKQGRDLMVNPEVYVCPFLGYPEDFFRTGCLIHPETTPNPEIKKIQKSQNVSLYGASICEGYHCISKEKFGPLADDSPFVASSKLYGKAAPNHNLRGLLQEISQKEKIDIGVLEKEAALKLAVARVPVTSFEMPLVFEGYSTDELWGVLGMLLLATGYLTDIFLITPDGFKVGSEVKEAVFKTV